MGYSRVSDANVITQKYMDSILIEERIIDSVVASTKTDFWGVEAFFGKVRNELRYIMSNTGFAKVSDIDDSVLWFM